MKKAFTPMKKKSVKGVMDGMPLTTEGVCQVCIKEIHNNNKLDNQNPMQRDELSY